MIYAINTNKDTWQGDKNVKCEASSLTTTKTAGIITVIPISGPLDFQESEFLDFFGGTSYEAIKRAINKSILDTQVSTIILKFSSAGGSVFGCSELANLIYEARKYKKIISFACPYAFSAAYHLASAAESVYCMPSGMVGSVGAYTMHMDYSEMLKNEGIKATYIYAGERKVDGNPYEPLSETAKKDMQEQVNYFYNSFVNDVAKFRNLGSDTVKENFGQGGSVVSEKALSNNMIDGILNFEDLISQEFQNLEKDFEYRQKKVFKNSLRSELNRIIIK